ncbi:MAG TPA: hypothetical protein ENH29_09505 [Bacteroidetes bacterium]|nr:hypothetical protein [Bacteroidota bacterium]
MKDIKQITSITILAGLRCIVEIYGDLLLRTLQIPLQNSPLTLTCSTGSSPHFPTQQRRSIVAYSASMKSDFWKWNQSGSIKNSGYLPGFKLR